MSSAAVMIDALRLIRANDDYISVRPGYQLDSIHKKPSAIEAVKSAEAIFVGKSSAHFNLSMLNLTIPLHVSEMDSSILGFGHIHCCK